MAHMLPVPELTFAEKLGKSKEQQAEMMAERFKGMQKYYEGETLQHMKEMSFSYMFVIVAGKKML